ncbi:MAG: response regulator transcription factor [Planctomycetota bacterium]|jgi:DNA-binding NarL/FixJ family response regulator|nr:response regulator transcription factor [Planctomycetota bacterium]
MPTTMVIVDDHEIVRRGLGSLLKDTEIRILAEAHDADGAVKAAKKHKPDVMLLDVRLGDTNGLDVIKRIRTASTNTRVVVLSAFDNPTYVARAVSAGAHDYVLKSSSRSEIIAAVTGAANGREPARSSELRRMAAAMSNKAPFANSEVQLTPRESQVLRLIAMGLSNQEIADSLEISVETVKEHVQNLLRKMAVSDRTQAAVWAIRHGVA